MLGPGVAGWGWVAPYAWAGMQFDVRNFWGSKGDVDSGFRKCRQKCLAMSTTAFKMGLMGEIVDSDREGLRAGNEEKYRMWAVENFKLIGFEALRSLFGGPEAHRIKADAEAMSKMTSAVDRKKYQRDWLREKRAAEKAAKQAETT